MESVRYRMGKQHGNQKVLSRGRNDFSCDDNTQTRNDATQDNGATNYFRRRPRRRCRRCCRRLHHRARRWVVSSLSQRQSPHPLVSPKTNGTRRRCPWCSGRWTRGQWNRSPPWTPFHRRQRGSGCCWRWVTRRLVAGTEEQGFAGKGNQGGVELWARYSSRAFGTIVSGPV